MTHESNSVLIKMGKSNSEENGKEKRKRQREEEGGRAADWMSGEEVA